MPNELSVFSVGGMSCQHCVDRIKNAVSELNGVNEVEVDLGKKKVRVEYNPELVSSDIIKGVIEDQGYEVK
jgi:copper ion binding protein